MKPVCTLSLKLVEEQFGKLPGFAVESARRELYLIRVFAQHMRLGRTISPDRQRRLGRYLAAEIEFTEIRQNFFDLYSVDDS
jgi:hypothetical protein